MIYTFTKYYLGDQVIKNVTGRALTRIGERRDTYRILVGRLGGRRPLGRPTHRWVDDTNMDLQEVGCGAWTGSIWFRTGTGGGHL
jgi:hypothetical protein